MPAPGTNEEIYLVIRDHPKEPPQVIPYSRKTEAIVVAAELLGEYLEHAELEETSDTLKVGQLLDKRKHELALELWNTKARPKNHPFYRVEPMTVDRIPKSFKNVPAKGKPK